ncbi:MAG TPA: ATP-binding protein [Salinimicrobium sp.]|nr:ATP-binding protein [Salinimicrobium sp.]
MQIVNLIYKIHKLIPRQHSNLFNKYLEIFPAIAILGPRQSGKSTFVKLMSNSSKEFLYLDLQNQTDLNKLNVPSLFFEANKDSVICLDEIQLVPELFSVLRSEIDKNRWNGRFILLGSASRDLIQKTSESLAGRIGFLHLGPFSINEVIPTDDFSLSKFWYRGGYPESYLAKSDENSRIWRDNYIRTYVERDIPQLGFQIPAQQIRRLLMMCSHNQGQLLNSSKLGESLGLTHPTVRKYLDLLEQTFIIRIIPPYINNIKKRLVKSPKIFVRDSGLLHQFLSIENFNDLLGNPIFGASWEGMVVQNIITGFPDWEYFFYRTSNGDEIDLILKKGNKTVAVECKASSAPKTTKGFWNALEDVKPDRVFIVAPVDQPYFLEEKIMVTPIQKLLETEL